MPRRPGPPSPVQLDATAPPAVHLAGQHPRTDVERLVRHGTWVRIRHGVYVDAAWLSDGPDADRRRALARLEALRRTSPRPPLLLRESAALAWGLPLVVVPEVSHTAGRSNPTSHGARDVVRHVVDVPVRHTTEHRGYRVTTLERTAVDCATVLHPYAALVVADAALHVGADRDVMLALLDAARGRRGVRRARAVLEVADGGAESPGETWTRWTVLRLGYPVPETQVPVDTGGGRYWADIGYPAWRLLIEYDGAEKYGTDGRDAVAALRRERRRQLAVEDAGWRVVRVTAHDRRHVDAFEARLRTALPDAPRTARPHLHPPPA
ncbi:hypothetical protein AB6N23_00505 [Cellulomonas sp. 179-A 9B4 NHS]|uniref:hypothetical protein n=1 Tax=Cellulomonas sp. 179-A 9B4 NHS TaxID=3142379 RepID=UPI00399F852A